MHDRVRVEITVNSSGERSCFLWRLVVNASGALWSTTAAITTTTKSIRYFSWGGWGLLQLMLFCCIYNSKKKKYSHEPTGDAVFPTTTTTGLI